MFEALADLRHRSLQRSPAYTGGPDALAVHLGTITEGARQGRVEQLREGARARAFWCTWHEERHPFFHAPYTALLAHHDGSEAGTAWLRRSLPDALDAHGAGTRTHLDCMLPAWDRATRELLLSLGLGIASVNLAGRLQPALDRLLTVYDPPSDLRDWGLSLAPYDVEDADEVVALHARVFGEEPAYAWFAAAPQFLENMAVELRAPEQPGHRLVVRRGRHLLGELHGAFRAADPHNGPSVSVGFTLDRSIRGRGVGKVLYRRVLEAAGDAGMSWVKGTTGRRSVLHLGRVMGRELTGVTLRSGPVFTDGRFDAALKAAQARALPWGEALLPPAS